MRTLIAALLLLWPAAAQQMEDNYDESKAGTYTLPDPLVFANGQPVRDARAWARRRAEILALFESQIYGRTVGTPTRPVFEAPAVDRAALGGKAIRKQIRVRFAAEGPQMDILLYIPAGAKAPVPCFVGLNFGGNHTVHADPGIRLGQVWRRRAARRQATEAERGSDAASWQVEKILEQGYALATAYYEEIEPDFYGGITYGSARAGPGRRPDRPPGRRVGRHRRLGLGPEPDCRLPGHRPRHRREATRGDGPLAPGQNRALGRRPGCALRRRYLQRFRRRWGRAGAP